MSQPQGGDLNDMQSSARTMERTGANEGRNTNQQPAIMSSFSNNKSSIDTIPKKKRYMVMEEEDDDELVDELGDEVE